MAQDWRWEPYLSDVRAPEETALQALERRAPGPLPPAYLDDLRQHSGKMPEPGGVTVGRGGSTLGVLLLVDAAGENASYSIDHAVEALVEWSHGAAAAQKLWPFASNTATCLFCFDFRSEAPGAEGPPVVFIDLAGGDFEDGMFDEREVLPVAPSYTELLKNLRD